MAARIALTGFLVLLVALGIGRFAFTPQLPLMIAEGQLTLTSAGLVAAANYLGYLVGAWDAMRARRGVERRLLIGACGVVVLTLLSALANHALWHGLLRFLLGWASGWSMVFMAAWSNEQLTRLGRPQLSAAVFAGSSIGIVLSGLLAVVIHHFAFSASTGWLCYGLLAFILLALVVRNFPRPGDIHSVQSTPQPLVLTAGLKRLVLSYSLAGFGYILPATFLSQIVTVRFPGTLLAQFIWPLFGLAATAGILLSIVMRHWLTNNQRLALVLGLQASGIFAAEIVPGMAGMICGALLVGGGFMVVVQLALQYGAELAPQHRRYIAGLLTTGYAIGQLVGPLLSAISTALTHRLEPALYIAGAALLIAGLLVWKRADD